MNEVEVVQDGRVGRLRLNRPKAINALNLDMVDLMTTALLDWRDDPGIDLIMIDHAEGRGFCAGGDVVAIAKDVQGHGVAGDAFFYREYQMNHLMYTFSKPGIVFMDGVTMGGGVGITCPSKYRVATERTIFAMPETGIGLFPDVGGGRYLSRLPNRLAQFLGLTGGKLNGADCYKVNLATHYVPSERLEQVKRELCADPSRIEDILHAASVPPPTAPIIDQLPQINDLFASDRLEDILAALEADDSEWAAKQLAILRTKSPLSCKVTLRLLLVSPHIKNFADEMRLEFGLVHRMFRTHDFAEGVRALLIDRDNAPRWEPATSGEVSDKMINRIFEPLRGEAAWRPLEPE
ncbi:enoyl-CoA hydratase [Sphingobium lactosutens]|nr:enoyl-CoA hydratase [Sphingobium lactosutens]